MTGNAEGHMADTTQALLEQGLFRAKFNNVNGTSCIARVGDTRVLLDRTYPTANGEQELKGTDPPA